MKSNKQRVFLAARRRGYTAAQVNAMLHAAGAPPSRSECRADRGHRMVPMYDQEIGPVRVPMVSGRDRRDIPAEMADELIRRLMAEELKEVHHGE